MWSRVWRVPFHFSVNELVLVESEPLVTEVKTLFREYAAGLNVNLCFQDFDQELEKLPGDYKSPQGRLVLARHVHVVAGCCALRPLKSSAIPNAAELKRLYVRPNFRGTGLGRQMAEYMINAAKEIGYASVVLDTLPTMQEARQLYARMGFRPIAPYYESPVEGTAFLQLSLK
jgi:putative acetyltransferase